MNDKKVYLITLVVAVLIFIGIMAYVVYDNEREKKVWENYNPPSLQIYGMPGDGGERLLKKMHDTADSIEKYRPGLKRGEDININIDVIILPK